MPQISSDENDILTSSFPEKAVFYAISQREHNKAPGPDGFSMEISQHKIGIILKEI